MTQQQRVFAIHAGYTLDMMQLQQGDNNKNVVERLSQHKIKLNKHPQVAMVYDPDHPKNVEMWKCGGKERRTQLHISKESLCDNLPKILCFKDSSMATMYTSWQAKNALCLHCR